MIQVDVVEIINEIERTEALIDSGPISELIEYAKLYNIHQTSTQILYNEKCERIKQRLIANNIDPDTVRSE